MPKHNLCGQWQAWSSAIVANEFYCTDFVAEPQFMLTIPGHWQLQPELAKHQGSMFYRTVFDWQPTLTWPVTRLCIGGAFYQTTAWLNGELLGQHDGYFTPMSWEIRPEQLQPVGNVLAIRLDCPPPGTTWRDIAIGIYGDWDCKPAEVNPGGIWGEVALVETFRGYLQQLQINSRLTAWNSAQIRLQGDFVWRSVASQVKARVVLAPRNFVGKAITQDFSVSAQPGTNSLDLKLSLPEPKLWWTWDQGNPNLYDVTLQLIDEQGCEVDSQATYIGIRDLDWKNWRFSLNGRRMFLRGANYGPTSFYPATVTREELERDVELLTEANLNFVRVHNHVALPEFYRLCAEAGLAIWQDFPLDKRYDRNITGIALRQIRSMVTSLHNEPAICFWSCHNEPYATLRSERRGSIGIGSILGHVLMNIRPSWNKDILDPRLQEAVLQLDQTRPVIAHSGVFGFLRGGSATNHYHGWNTADYRSLIVSSRLFPRIIRLVNEYGAQALPDDADFLSQVSEMGGIWPHLHWKKIQSKFLAITDVLHEHVSPEDYPDITSYAHATQRYQAELLQFYHEFLRRHKYKPCGGAVLFYFADAMPLISWSIVDAKRQPKLAYQVTRRAMQPVQVMIDWPKRCFTAGEKWRTPIYVVNDLSRPLPTMGLTWQLSSNERVLLRDRGVAEAEADAVSRVGTMVLPIPEDLEAGMCELKLELMLSLANNQTIKNEYVIRVQS